MIYVDNAATTFPKPEVVYQALDKANRTLAFNAGRGESAESEMASMVIDNARGAISSFLPGTPPNRVVFTSSATDALNKLILGLDLLEGDTVYVSPFEHNAIIRPLRRLEENGVKIKILPFDPETWELDEAQMRQQFAIDNPVAVLVSHISNVTGYELPFATIFAASRKYGSTNILDAAQSYGVFPIREIVDVSYIVFAGHKSLYASFGVAGFVAIEDKKLLSVIRGGTGSDSLNPDMPNSLPGKYESGSPNVVAISSLLASIPWLKERDLSVHESALSEYFREQLKTNSKVKVFYPEKKRTNGILSIALKGYSAAEVGIILKEKGISARTGYHCAPLIHEFIGSNAFQGTVRFSFGAFNKTDDVDTIIQVLRGL